VAGFCWVGKLEDEPHPLKMTTTIRAKATEIVRLHFLKLHGKKTHMNRQEGITDATITTVARERTPGFALADAFWAETVRVTDCGLERPDNGTEEGLNSQT